MGDSGRAAPLRRSQVRETSAARRGCERFVLVSPVRNERKYIGQTIESVCAQTRRPCEWVIVSDGSDDGTDELVLEAARAEAWIRLVRRPPRQTHSFAAVVDNTVLGVQCLSIGDFDYIGLLDGDVRFDPDYFQRLLEEFERRPRLGLAGGVVIDVGQPRDKFPSNRSDVPGAVQFFRRSCFEKVVPLLPIPEGGWDVMTCVAARLHGFETRLCTDLVVDHLKPRNVSQGGELRRRFQFGVREFACGFDPCFQFVKAWVRVAEPPFGLSALARVAGYWVALLRGQRRIVPVELVRRLRFEQRRRLVGRGVS